MITLEFARAYVRDLQRDAAAHPAGRRRRWFRPGR
jgi:hypothetical protein